MGIKKGQTDLQRIIMTDSDYYDKMTILDQNLNAQIQVQMNEMYKTKNDLLREYNLHETMGLTHPGLSYKSYSQSKRDISKYSKLPLSMMQLEKEIMLLRHRQKHL